jgi:antitoxin ParD1/3/4
MPAFERLSDALRDWTHKRKLRDHGLSKLHKLWLEAIADDSEGLDPVEVFDRLETKYDRLAQETGR